MQSGHAPFNCLNTVMQLIRRVAGRTLLCGFSAYLEKDGHVASDLNLKAKIPPTLIIHSEDDSNFITGSKLYHAALTEAKVAHEFKLYTTGGHGHGLRSERAACVWPEYALEWLPEIHVW